MSVNEPDAGGVAEPVEPVESATAPVEVEPPEPEDWRRRERFGSALAQIAVVAVLLAGLVAWRYHRATERIADAEQVQAARELARSDAPEELLGALKALEPPAARGVREANALSARLHVELWRTHGLTEHEGPAREQLALAERADAPSEDRYAARALVLLMDGKAAEAEALYRDVERRGGQAPWLSYALGRALQARGDFRGAAGWYQRAVEAGWKDPGLLASCGEASLELGRTEDAARAFTGALSRESGHVRSLAGLALAKLFAGEAPTLAEKAVEAALARRDALTPGLRGRALAAAAELERQSSELEGSRGDAKGQRRSSKLEDARRDAEAAVAARPGDPVMALVRARVLLTAQDPAGGRALEEAAKAHPFAPAIALAAGAAGGAVGLAVLDEYARRFPAQLLGDQAYWLARGDALRSLGRAAEAVAAYESAVALGGRGAAKATAARAALAGSRANPP
jgi:predicted Zn-dependent protease